MQFPCNFEAPPRQAGGAALGMEKTGKRHWNEAQVSKAKQSKDVVLARGAALACKEEGQMKHCLK